MIQNRRKYVIAGTVMQLVLGTIYAWSYFKVYLNNLFPVWNQKQLSLNFTIMMILFAIGGLLGGRLSKHIRHRYLGMFSGFLLMLGYFMTSFLPTGNPGLALVLLYLFYGCFTGLGSGIGYNVIISAVNSWFPDKDGMISGLLLTGFGMGSLIVGKLADVVLQQLSLFTVFRLLGIICGVIVIGGSFLLQAPDHNTPLPQKPIKAAASGGMEYTTGQMLRRPTFWIYFLWNLCISATGMLVINNASGISVYFGAAAIVGLLVSIFNSGGRLGIGWSMDRFGWKATMYIVNSVIIAAGVLMVLGNSTKLFPLVLTGMLLSGICYGGGITISASLIRTFYGNENYALNFSTCNLVSIPAAIVGPMISAALVDAAGGAFGPTFVMVVIMGSVSLCLNFFIRKP